MVKYTSSVVVSSVLTSKKGHFIFSFSSTIRALFKSINLSSDSYFFMSVVA
jgi:hypothetical protein